MSEYQSPGASTSPATSSAKDVWIASIFFVLSGAAALIDQVAWQRVLALTTGVGVASISIITAAFMAGLGIGSHWGGILSAGLSPRRALVRFGIIELGVAAFAALSIPIYYRVLYRELPFLYDGLLRATLTHLLSLLPPTLLMGMSLPFLVRAMVRGRQGAAQTIGILYAANALGAAMGAFATPWVLLRYLGVTGSTLVGAAFSACAGIGALLLSKRIPDTDPLETELLAPASPDEPARPFNWWIVLYALSGFVSLSLEIVWFRIIDVAAKGAAFTFGTLLSVYLIGLAAGSLVAAKTITSFKRPLVSFLLCQVGIVLMTVAAIEVLVYLPPWFPGIDWLLRYGAQPIGVRATAFVLNDFLIAYVALPLLVFGPSTFLMGLGFPILQKATQADPRASGKRVGFLQAANIAGCTLGSLCTGLLALEAIGTAGVIRVLCAISIGVTLFGIKVTRERRFIFLAAGLVVVALAFPDNDRMWRRMIGDPDPELTIIEENAASVTALTPQPDDSYHLMVNGRYNSWLPFGWLHSVIGALPALAHPHPQEVAVVGLGSGDTAWGAGIREETVSLRVFEIASSQPRLLQRASSRPKMERLTQFLADPRYTVVRDDGRRRLTADGKRYDIIVADAYDFDNSMITYLYSVEYYTLVRERLKPGGLVCVLARTPRIRAAVRRAFPYTVYFRDDLILAGADPIVIDKDLWLLRLHSDHVVDYIGKARMREIAAFVAQARYPEPAPPGAFRDANRDLDPRDEFGHPYPR